MLIGWLAGVLLLTEALSIGAYLLHRRRVRIFREPSDDPVTLILPLTGRAPGLELLIDRLAAHTQPIVRLMINV